jgi:hypothetical protein
VHVDAINTIRGSAGHLASFSVVSRTRFRRLRSSRRFMRLVRFPAAPPEGPQIGLVSRSRTGRRRFQAQVSLRYIRSWRCHCGGDNSSRTCDAAEVSARAAKRPVPPRIPAFSGRTSTHRATAPSAFRPRRLPRRIAPAINPQKKPRRKNLRARRLFLRTTADAMNPHVAAIMATARREIRCVGPSDPNRNLRAVVCVGRLPDPTIVFAGPALLANVGNQSEDEALAARCLTTWLSLIAEARGRVSDTIAVSWHSLAQFSASPDLHNEFLSAVDRGDGLLRCGTGRSPGPARRGSPGPANGRRSARAAILPHALEERVNSGRLPRGGVTAHQRIGSHGVSHRAAASKNRSSSSIAW